MVPGLRNLALSGASVAVIHAASHGWEAVAYVQASRLKAIAIVSKRFSNSQPPGRELCMWIKALSSSILLGIGYAIWDVANLPIQWKSIIVLFPAITLYLTIAFQLKRHKKTAELLSDQIDLKSDEEEIFLSAPSMILSKYEEKPYALSESQTVIVILLVVGILAAIGQLLYLLIIIYLAMLWFVLGRLPIYGRNQEANDKISYAAYCLYYLKHTSLNQDPIDPILFWYLQKELAVNIKKQVLAHPANNAFHNSSES